MKTKEKLQSNEPIILGIDTSCDDTSIAITRGKTVLANVSWAKMKLHSDLGGVVPSEAKRQHLEFLDPAIKRALKDAQMDLKDIDYIAVTYGPGLAIALEAGIMKAKELSKKYNKPLIAVNHMIGHIYANLAKNANEENLSKIKTDEYIFPSLGIAISGGHTSFYLINKDLNFKTLGETVDDAIGEAFDKVGRMLGMGFPAGAKVEKAAKQGNANKYGFPRPMLNSGDYNFSFSGLKTAVLYQIKKILGEYNKKQEKKTTRMEDFSGKLTTEEINDIAASFQKAAFDTLIVKTKRVIEEYSPKMLIIGGGVIANKTLRNRLEDELSRYKIQIVYPAPIWLCTDNAVMVNIAAYYMAKQNMFVSDIENLDRVPSLSL